MTGFVHTVGRVWVDSASSIRYRADVRPDIRKGRHRKSHKDRCGDFMTARVALHYVGCTLGPVIPDEIFVGS